MNTIAPGAVPLVDGHVHYYPLYSEEALLEGAFAHLRDQARRRGVDHFLALLLLADTEVSSWFSSLRRRAGGVAGGAWGVAPTSESTSLLLSRDDGAKLAVVAGRQVVTSEGLELLALATEAPVPGGEPLEAAVESVAAGGGIPVIPWGAGKWWGRRGRVLRDYLLRAGEETFCFLGDNGGRPGIATPPLFRLAERRGLRILPGSDPLPLPGAEDRVGRRGFSLQEPIDAQRPAAALRRILRGGGGGLSPFGESSSLTSFLRDQIRLRLPRRAPGGEGEGMKVLLLAPQPFYQERGTPIAVRLLARTLTEGGHLVDLLTYHEGSEVSIAGLTHHRIRPPRFVRNVPIGFSWKKVVCDLYLGARARSLLRRGGHDVVHAVEESIFFASSRRALRGRKLVYDMDSLLSEQLAEGGFLFRLIRPLLEAAEGAVIRRADAVMPMCERLAARVRLIDPAKEVTVLEDVPLLGGEGEREGLDLRERFGIEGPLALYVGNLESYQGVDLLLEALARAGGVPDLHLAVVGGGEGEVARARGRAEGLGIGGRVHCTGHRPVAELASYLRQADFLVSPRLAGVNTPMKIYSYLDSGKAVLATDIPSHTQVLDSSCALLVPPEAAAMAGGLERLAADAALRRGLGEAGASRVRERYSLGQFRRKLLDAYARLEGRAEG